MGFPGLLGFIKKRKAFQMIDLVEIAKEKQGIQILIDTNAFHRFLMEISLKKLAKDYKNDFLSYPVGEYDLMDHVYSDFHNSFNDVGITLVWFIDCPKGVDQGSSAQKKLTWEERDKASIDKYEKMFLACDRKEKIEDFNDCGPIIGLESGLEQLKNAGAEVIYLFKGEGDDVVAKTYKKRKAYAVITNSIDFILFEDCNVIFQQLLSTDDGKDDLKLPFIDKSSPGKIFCKPHQFMCPIINSKDLLKIMNFDNHDNLLALALLRGTRELSKELIRLTTKTQPYDEFTMLANFIRERNIDTNNFGSIKQIREYMVHHPELQASIQYSRELHYDKVNSVGPVIHDSLTLTGYLAEGVSRGKINRLCYAIHYGTYYMYVCAERLNENCPSIMDILGNIRLQIYPFLLDKILPTVREWRLRVGEIVEVKVNHKEIQADKIEGIPDGIKYFEEIWSVEETAPLNYVKKYGMEKALILYLLRYLHTMTNNKNLRVSIDEFKALFITVFYQYALWKKIALEKNIEREEFLTMNICPSARCMTIVTWFMNIYYTAKYICGGALDLTEQFPPPVAIMNGSTWFAFFSIMTKDNQTLNSSTKVALHAVKDNIMTTFGDELEIVTKE